MTKQELQLLIDATGKAVRRQDLTGSDFSGMDLSGVDFKRSTLVNVNFSSCNLTNCTFVLADISGVDFSGAIIDGVNWEQVQSANLANFIGAIVNNEPIEKNAVVDVVGGYQRLITDKFIQIGCMNRSPAYWQALDTPTLEAEIAVINPSETATAVAWKDTHLPDTISEYQQLTEENP